MKIDRIDLYHVAMPLITPWRTAYGEDAVIHSLLCRLESGSLFAWGESSPLQAPCYSPEWAASAFGLAKDWLAPRLLGEDITTGEQLQQRFGLFKGNPFAKAVFDHAWWNLSAQFHNQPLHEHLGATRSQVPVGADFGVGDSVEELMADIETAVDAGFLRTKLKFRPGWGLEMLQAVCTHFSDHTFHIDCNSGYRFADRYVFDEVDQYELAMIEQPLQHDDLWDHAKLQKEISTPICLDESINSVDRARQAIEMGSCQYLNIKPGRVGGLTNAIAIHNLAAETGIPCWVGGMLESAIGVHTCIALAMLDNCTYPADIFPSSRFYHEDLCTEPVELITDSKTGSPGVSPPNAFPVPDSRRLQTQTVQHCCLK